MRYPTRFGCWLGFVLILGGSLPAWAADVLLDLPVTAGTYVFYPTREDRTKFRYAPISARLARHPSGLPQFSFLRFVENVRSEAGAADVREGVGGGIVHAVVALGGTEEDLEAATKVLQEFQAGAQVVGSVQFESGQFSLVSTFADEGGDFTRTLVGTGAAPVLDDSKAAISLRLSKLGAKVLWESFHSATPDIAFLFSMELQGFKTPKQAVLEADFEEVYDHKSFYQNTAQASSMDFGINIPVDEIITAVSGGSTAGMLPDIDVGISGHMGSMTQNEIDKAFTELRTSGAIRIEWVGEDAELKEIVRDAYDALRDVILAPAGRIAPKTAPRSVVATRGNDSKSKTKTKAKKNKKKSGASNKSAAKKNAKEARKKAEEKAKAEAEKAKANADKAKADADKAKADADKAKADADKAKATADADKAKTAATKEVDLAKLKKEEIEKKRADKKKERDERRARRKPLQPAPVQVDASKPDCKGVGIKGPAAPMDKVVSLSMSTDFCQVTRYKVRKTKQTGTYRLDLRKYTASITNVPFAQNIGDLRQYTGNPSVFRSVNLDDPLYVQREVAVLLNGLNAADFDKYVNFVTVQMRKEHEGGEITPDEVRIDRKTINRTGNDFKLLYGWKGDDDRSQWFDYQWRAQWSFVGGNSTGNDWQPAQNNAIDLVPPFERRTIRLEGSPEIVDDLDVRMVKVRIHYPVGEEERTIQETLIVDREDLSRAVEIIVPVGELDYDYEISWRFRGGFSVETGRQTTSDDTLFVDEIPDWAWGDDEDDEEETDDAEDLASVSEG